MRQIFLDTETTGLNPHNGDRIVEVACVEMLNRRLTDQQQHFYLNPERSNSEDAVRIHGLTDEFLADKPLFPEVADELMAFLSGAELIIHNAAFDIGFLDEEFKRCKRPPTRSFVHAITDSLGLARELFPGKSNSLDALCKRLEVDNTHRTFHGALLDARLLAEVYIRMTRGQETLAIDAGHDDPNDTGEAGTLDLSRFQLKVWPASEAEMAAHEAVLAELDKASGGRTVWRQMELQWAAADSN
jgi:DNA polymerase III subunit epsilon